MEADQQEPAQDQPDNNGDQLDPEQHARAMSYVRRVHFNLNHPPNPVLARMLVRTGARPEIVRLARGFSCEVCQERARPCPRMPAASTPLPINGHEVVSDGFEWQHPTSLQKVRGYLMLDGGSDFAHGRVVHVRDPGGNLPDITGDWLKKLLVHRMVVLDGQAKDHALRRPWSSHV